MEAQKWLSNFIKDEPNNPEALSLFSQILLLDEKVIEAEQFLSAASAIRPELPSVYLNRARLLLKQAKPMEALKNAQSGYGHTPKENEARLVLAACLGANQKDNEALTLIEEILKECPNHADALANRAGIRLRQNDIPQAIQDAKDAVTQKPHLTKVWKMLSSLLYKENNLAGAIEILRQALKKNPDNISIILQLSEFLSRDQKVSEAITILEKATKIQQEDSELWAAFGAVLQRDNRFEDAKIAYQKALKLGSDLAAIFNNLGIMEKDKEPLVNALNYFKKAVGLEPYHPEVHYNIGLILNKMGRLTEAGSGMHQSTDPKTRLLRGLQRLGEYISGDTQNK